MAVGELPLAGDNAGDLGDEEPVDARTRRQIVHHPAPPQRLGQGKQPKVRGLRHE